MSPTELPVNVTMPLIISGGSSHSAAVQDISELCTKLNNYMSCICNKMEPLYSRLHSGGGTDGYVAELSFTCVHVMVLIPINSKSELQV